jgi:hypothetical protein
MTVKQLIEILEKLPAEMPVIVPNGVGRGSTNHLQVYTVNINIDNNSFVIDNNGTLTALVISEE